MLPIRRGSRSRGIRSAWSAAIRPTIVESVTVAVDATAAVVDDVPERRPAARAPSAAAARRGHRRRQHRQGCVGAPADPLRAARCSPRTPTPTPPHPGVSDALAEALGLTVEDVLEPVMAGADLDKWVIFVPPANAEAVRAAVFDAGAGQIGDYSCCSWSVTGTGQFLPHDGATPAIGSVGTVERLAEDRRRGDRTGPAARSGLCGDAGRPPVRGAGVRRHRAGAAARRCRASGRIAIAAATGAVARFRRPGAAPGCRPPRGGCAPRRPATCRCPGSRCAAVRGIRCSPRSPRRMCRPT